MNESPSASPSVATAWRGLFVFVLLACAGIAVAHWGPWRASFTMEGLRRAADHLGWWGPVLIVLLGLILPQLFLPRWPVAFTAGVLYGVVEGTLLSLAVCVAGAWLQFALARTVFASVGERTRARPVFRRLAEDPSRQFGSLLLLRLFPLSNSSATNLLAGGMGIRHSVFLGSAFLGMLPSTVMFVSWGKLIKKPDPGFYALATGLLILVAVLTLAAGRRLRAAGGLDEVSGE